MGGVREVQMGSTNGKGRATGSKGVRCCSDFADNGGAEGSVGTAGN